MPKPKDYEELKPYWDFQRKKEYHKKFIWKLIPKEHQEIREGLYNMIIKKGMIDDYAIPDGFHVGDDLPGSQPPQIKWAWNCMNYRVSKISRPFILITSKDKITV